MLNWGRGFTELNAVGPTGHKDSTEKGVACTAAPTNPESKPEQPKLNHEHIAIFGTPLCKFLFINLHTTAIPSQHKTSTSTASSIPSIHSNTMASLLANLSVELEVEDYQQMEGRPYDRRWVEERNVQHEAVLNFPSSTKVEDLIRVGAVMVGDYFEFDLTNGQHWVVEVVGSSNAKKFSVRSVSPQVRLPTLVLAGSQTRRRLNVFEGGYHCIPMYSAPRDDQRTIASLGSRQPQRATSKLCGHSSHSERTVRRQPGLSPLGTPVVGHFDGRMAP